jgi:peroxiredoxin
MARSRSIARLPFLDRRMSIRFSRRLFFHCAFSVLLVVAGGHAFEESANKVALVDLEGRPVDPLKADGWKAVVFLFVGTDCPISNRYAPEVRRLYGKFHAVGVAFWLVYPDPDESTEAIRRHVKEHSYAMGVLCDRGHALVKLTGARVTPEAAVFVPRGQQPEMVYRGRIDDWYVDFGKARPAPTSHDLEQSLEAVVEGKAVRNRTVPAVGCSIPDLPQP